MRKAPEDKTALPASDVREMALELDKFKEIVENASDAVVTINQNHEVVFMNRAAEDMFGYPRIEILGGDLAPLIPAEHRDAHRHYVERYVRTRQARLVGHAAEVRAQRKDGERFPVSISFSVADSDQGLLLTAIMRDLSSERALNAKVRNAQALADVGRMAATVSHEIKTPLALIGGFAAQLKREPGVSGKGLRKLDIIVEEVARLEGMLAEINDLSRPQRYDWREVDLCEVVRQVSELMNPKLGVAGMVLDVNCHDNLPLVTGDRNRLRQVLINLVNNAVQAGGEKGAVEVEIYPAEGQRLLVEVRDCGCGIPTGQIREIFTPFFTTKKQGTGLGLPLAKRIITEHGGKIKVESREDEGTKVTITLPAIPPGEPNVK